MLQQCNAKLADDSFNRFLTHRDALTFVHNLGRYLDPYIGMSDHMLCPDMTIMPLAVYEEE